MAGSTQIEFACALAMFALACAPPNVSSEGGSSTTEDTASETTTSETSPTESETGPDVDDCSAATRVITTEVVIESAAQMAELADVVEIHADLSIDDDSMTELVGANCLERIHGRLTIAGNDALVRIDDAFASLRHIGDGTPTSSGAMFITDNPALVSLTGLRALERIDGRTLITDNDTLVELRLDALTEVGENMSIRNASLPNLHGLSALTSVRGDLAINCDAIVDLDGLQNLAVLGAGTTGGSLSIFDNEALISMDGLTLAEIPNLRIRSNPALVDLGGLEPLVTITHSLTIEDNDALVSLHGLDNLVEMPGGSWLDGVSIIGNASLISLDGLEALATVEQHLHVCDNPALDDLGALAGLVTLGRLTAIYNDSLPNPEAEAIAATLPNIEWVKIDANGVLDPLWWDKPMCPWVGDSICDEDFEFQGDVGIDCEVDCCVLYGPTHLCADETDDDCQDDPIGPP